MAQSAGSQHDQRIKEATTYALTSHTRTEAEAKARLEKGHTLATRTLLLAKSRNDRFVAIQAEMQKERELTIRRYYLEALHNLLPKVRRKLVFTSDEPVDLSLLDRHNEHHVLI